MYSDTKMNGLMDKHPKLFKEKDLSPQQTCMCWGITCEDGWYEIVDALCASIQGHIDHERECVPIRKENSSLKHVFMVFPKMIRGRWRRWRGKQNWTIPSFNTFKIELRGWWRNRKLQPPQQVVIGQMKEKFGLLRVYTNGHDKYVSGLISMAESMSARTCEQCGNPGTKLNDYGWIRTLCISCREETEKARKERAEARKKN